MTNGKLAHPDAEQLNAFGLGQLDPVKAAEVERHLTSCTVCCQTLWSLPDDRLVALLRQAFTQPPSSETTTVLPSAATLGPQLPPELAEHPRYRIVEVLGQGGMGTVYKAEHRLMERRVALKVIDRGLTGKPAVVERFRREVKTAAQLNHPNIVHAYDAEQAGDNHFLVMEFIEGTSLDRLIQQQGPLPPAKACDYVRQAALGLQRALEHGMVHRDIKPQNLMLTPQGEVKILDFGLARLMSETSPSLPAPPQDALPEGASPTLTQLGMVMGTADYMAPEQASDAHAADIRSDLYSLGCTLYYLLTGQPPFPQGTVLDKLLAHGTRTPRPMSEFRQDVPAGLTRVVARLMAKDPAQRYQTPAEAAEALQPFAAPQRRRWPAPWRWAAALLVCGVMAVAAAIITISTDQGQLVLETNDDNIAVQIEKAGVKISDRSGKREYLLKKGKQRLPSGEYDIEVAELPDGIALSTSKFQLRRSDTVRVTARFRRVETTATKLPRTFGVADKPLTQDGVTVDQGGWHIEAKAPRTVRLFEIANPDVELCRVIYQAKLKCEKLDGKAYLEMWCRLPDAGEFFSKGFPNAVTGTTDWVYCETPFFLKKGERPDLIKLNVVIEGKGTLWIKDIALRKAPLPPEMKLNP